MAEGRMYSSQMSGAPALGTYAEGFLELMAWIVGQEGWQAERVTVQYSESYYNSETGLYEERTREVSALEITPAEGAAGTLRLVEITPQQDPGQEYQYESTYHCYLTNVYQSDAAKPLAGYPEIQAKARDNLSAGLAWETGLSRDELLTVLGDAATFTAPILPNTPYARLPPDIRAMIRENLEAGNEWHEGMTVDTLQRGVGAIGIDYIGLYMSGKIPSAISGIVYDNYMAGRNPLTGLSSADIINLAGIAGVAFSMEDLTILLHDPANAQERLSAETWGKISENVLNKVAWHTGLSSEALLEIWDVFGYDFKLSDFGSKLHEGLPTLSPISAIGGSWQGGSSQEINWAAVCGPSSLIVLVGRPAQLLENGSYGDQYSPDIQVTRYGVLFAFGSALHPTAPDWFLAAIASGYMVQVTTARAFGSLGKVPLSGEGNEGRYVWDTSNLYESVNSGVMSGFGYSEISGGENFGAPPIFPNGLWLEPSIIRRGIQASAYGPQIPLPYGINDLVGVLPYLLLHKNWVDPHTTPSGTEYAPGLTLFHTANGGSLTLTTKDIPLTASYGD